MIRDLILPMIWIGISMDASTVKASSKEEAENLAKSQAEAYLQAWAADQNAANEKYGVYMF